MIEPRPPEHYYSNDIGPCRFDLIQHAPLVVNFGTGAHER
jgi:hypothetical protein